MKKIIKLLLFLIPFSLFPCDLEGHFDFEVKDSQGRVLYSGCYDAINHGPHIVTWVLRPEALDDTNNSSASFTQQRDQGKLLHELTRARIDMPANSDYTNSGYDRGHMAPAEDFDYSQEAKTATYFMANIWPQKHAFNAGPWLELEEYEREIAATFGAVKITIIVDEFTNEWIGDRPTRRIRVPAYFIKILEYENYCEIYKMPNDENATRGLEQYLLKRVD